MNIKPWMQCPIPRRLSFYSWCPVLTYLRMLQFPLQAFLLLSLTFDQECWNRAPCCGRPGPAFQGQASGVHSKSFQIRPSTWDSIAEKVNSRRVRDKGDICLVWPQHGCQDSFSKSKPVTVIVIIVLSSSLFWQLGMEATILTHADKGTGDQAQLRRPLAPLRHNPLIGTRCRSLHIKVPPQNQWLFSEHLLCARTCTRF